MLAPPSRVAGHPCPGGPQATLLHSHRNWRVRRNERASRRVDLVKLDGSLVVPIEKSPIDREFLDSLTNLLHSLGLKVAGGFVENAVVLRSLEESGVDYVQGFYLGRPEPLIALAA